AELGSVVAAAGVEAGEAGFLDLDHVACLVRETVDRSYEDEALDLALFLAEQDEVAVFAWLLGVLEGHTAEGCDGFAVGKTRLSLGVLDRLPVGEAAHGVDQDDVLAHLRPVLPLEAVREEAAVHSDVDGLVAGLLDQLLDG